MLNFWDWQEYHKIVAVSNSKFFLVHQRVGMEEFAAWYRPQWGRPSITTVVAVTDEFYETYKEDYRANGILFEGNDEVGEL